MNSKKKIIYTLRSADKAAVEKLMEEAAKKDEIFAKARKRAGQDDEYTDVVTGTEQYTTKKLIVQTVSRIAASLLLVAGLGSVIHLLMKNIPAFENKPGDSNVNITYFSDNAVSHENTSGKKFSTTTVSPTKGSDGTSSVTTTYVTDIIVSGNAAVSTEIKTAENGEHDERTTTEIQPTEADATAEYIRDRFFNSFYNYDRLSADYSYTYAGQGKGTGTIKIDNTSMTGELYQKKLTEDGRFYCDERQYYLHDKYVYAGDYGEGGLIAKITDIRSELPADGIFDRVDFDEYPGFMHFIKGDMNSVVWEVTGERSENGRRIVSVNVEYGGDGSGLSVTADIDFETGICLSYDRYRQGELTASFRILELRLNNEADVPPSSHEVREFLENNGYDSHLFSNHSDYQISDLD